MFLCTDRFHRTQDMAIIGYEEDRLPRRYGTAGLFVCVSMCGTSQSFRSRRRASLAAMRPSTAASCS